MDRKKIRENTSESEDRAGHPGAEPHLYRVSELVAGLKNLLAERVGRLWVVGEVSNLRAAGSGHLYFTIKDEEAQLRAVLFRGVARQFPFEPEDGQEVLVYGDVTLYEARGELQIIVRQIEPRGRGALQLAIDQLRARLEKEGLFDASRKRVLPAFPRKVGIVTSPTAAALHDVIEVSRRRFPSAKWILSPTRVQGAGAEAEIAKALRDLYELHARAPLDVILLVRGGGSLEDLYPFSTEIVARTVAQSPVPLVTGIGHEIDVSIADLVADQRAPTPSAAAELALPDREEILARLRQDSDRLLWAVKSQLQRLRVVLAHQRATLRTLSPRARLRAQRAQFEVALRALARGVAARRLVARQRLAQSGVALRMLSPALRVRTERQNLNTTCRELLWRVTALQTPRQARLGQAAARLDALSPLAVLSRGYAIARRVRDGVVVTDVEAVAIGEALRIRVSNGEIDAAVTGARKLATTAAPASATNPERGSETR